MRESIRNKKYVCFGIAFMIVYSSFYFILQNGLVNDNLVKDEDGTILSENTQKIILRTRLPNALVRGFINDSVTMNGIEGANIKFSPDGVGVPVFNNTDSNGYYEVELLTSGDYSINVIKSGYSLHNGQISVSVGNDYWYNVTLTPLSMPISHINGTVTDKKTGLPIENAKIIFSGDYGGYYEATTNESGFYEQQLISDFYTVTATKEGYFSESEDIYIATGINVTIDFTLTP
ncbi:MAG: carboxypeptidase-like regulatory domain-containing protein, partial [Thermoplasmata archaeon]